ncbi:AAA domain-containing protein [Flavobacterium algicola]|uniref:AAA domain-containing protein n=1 Tax=Flavobacterium algicola TaxID=556529 RepID=UPI001EFCFD4F|nr:ATP-binding protein [Flavobacterium algicola]MCG9793313.1 ATP-binding protein [Flavobacterium algicola]
MAYQSYLVERFETTHENIFFRDLNNRFEEAYATIAGNHVFIGNISVGGHALDAVFIKNGALIVIDFKDYEGQLTFSENGPWKIKKNNDFIFVAGGAIARNPFQQVKAYRYSLFLLLSDKEGTILEPNHKVEWSHTNSIVLFHREIQFDNNEIPAKIQRFFHITDANNVIGRINDLHSSKLNLTDIEINNILKLLNIDDSSSYNAKAVIDEALSNINIVPARLERIKQLIPNVTNASEEIKAMAFYSTMISIERINESSVSDVCSYPMEWKNWTNEQYFVNIESHEQFHQIFRNNQSQRFPKNLFLSINVMMNGTIVPLFYTIIVNSDVTNLKSVDVNFDDFVLYRKILNELNLTEDTIEEIAALVVNNNTVQDKITAVSNYLDTPLILTETISLGLSSESIFTAQLQSELNQFVKGSIPVSGTLFESFVTGKKLPATTMIPEEKLIQVTPLNKFQKKAVALSFQQPLTVITGPPGTGKSQVVANILANAAIAGKKVLFASKNNQAVDNVYKRLNELLDTKYFLRLGTTEHIKEATKAIENVIENNRQKNFPNLATELVTSKQNYLQQLSTLSFLQAEIEAIEVLTKKEVELSDVLSNLNEEKEIWLKSVPNEIKELFIANALQIEIKNSDINDLRNGLKSGLNGGITGFIFKIFKQKKLTQKVKDLNEDLKQDIQKYVDEEAPYFANDVKVAQGLLSNINFIQELAKTQTDVQKTNDNHNINISQALSNLQQTKKRLKHCIAEKKNNEARILEIENQLPQLGREYLKYTINESNRLAMIEYLQEYKETINNNIPWKVDEKNNFAKVSNEFTSVFKAISLTSLTVKKAFLLQEELFDLVVIDEASQCDVASALPLLYRAKSAVIIGDPLQLPHITSVAKHEQDFVLEKLGLDKAILNYVNNSLFNHADSLGIRSGLKSAFLEEHFRCHPDIINFSNKYYYLPKAGHELDIKTTKEQFIFGNPGMNWVHTIGQLDTTKNVNALEVENCISLVKKLREENPKASIGIITPFKHQKEAIIRELNRVPNTQDILCDTVHKFQGDEKDIILFSLVVSTNARPSLINFINLLSPYIINVAVTRARSALYIIGNKRFCKSLQDNQRGKSLLSNLAYYADTVANKN